jgi:L-lactate utilization protein LutB
MAQTKNQIRDLESRTFELDEEVPRIDENVTKMKDGVVQWYNAQIKADEDIRNRVSSLEAFVQGIKANGNVNGGETFWNQSQE